MTVKFSKTFFVTLVLLLCIMLFSSGRSQQTEPVRDGVFIHISHGSDDPHRLLMGLKMAVMMAEGEKDVLVYCDIEAVKVVVASGPSVEFEGFPTSHQLLDRLKELKVDVMACPTCLEVAYLKPQDLRSGVRLAQKDLFFSFTKGRILSLDY